MVSRGNFRPSHWVARVQSTGLCPCGQKLMGGGTGARSPMMFQTSANRAPGARMCSLLKCAPSEPIHPSGTQRLLKFLSLPWPLQVPLCSWSLLRHCFIFLYRSFVSLDSFWNPNSCLLQSLLPGTCRAGQGGGSSSMNTLKTEQREGLVF